MVSVMKFLRRNALACLLEDTSLLRLLRLAMVGLQIMKYFSHRDKLHLLEALLQGLACFKILHFMLKLTLSSFNFHTCLLNSVQCFLLGFLKEVILLNLVLKVLAVSPTQVWFGPSLAETVANWYTIDSVRHWSFWTVWSCCVHQWLV